LLLSTLALDGSERGARRPGLFVRYADLLVLALALPVFLLAGWPLLGYAVAAAAWLAQHAILAAADRFAAASVAAGDRRRAMGAIGAATLARVWLVALAILLVGLLGEREDGLAAALLCLVLVTVHLICLGLTKLLYSEPSR
jgi:hypothetical protein